MRISFELTPQDLAQFRRALKRARDHVRSADESEIIEATKHALERLPIRSAPPFVRQRVRHVQRLVEMLEDVEWALPTGLRAGLVDALVYFSDPDDLIPDHIGVIGLLDDAIMLELVLQSHRTVLEAYEDFCTYRRTLGSVRGRGASAVARQERSRRLARRRATLLARTRSEIVGLKRLQLKKGR